MPQNSNAPRSQEDYITQISKEIEGRVTKKLSQVFSRTDNRILGALARLDDFLMKPLIQGNSEAAPETSRNAFSSNQGTKADDSQSDLHAEASISNNQTTGIVGPEEGQEMVTEVTKEVRNRHDLVTGFDVEVTYCFPDTCSGPQKKNRSNSQLHFSSENTPTTIEADLWHYQCRHVQEESTIPFSSPTLSRKSALKAS